MKKFYLAFTLLVIVFMFSACSLFTKEPQEDGGLAPTSIPEQPDSSQSDEAEPDSSQSDPAQQASNQSDPSQTDPSQQDPSKSNDPTQSDPEEEDRSKAEQLLKSMTLKEKIGQLLMIRLEALCTDLSAKQINDTHNYAVTEFNSQMAETLKNYPVGGIALFGKNIQSPSQLTDFIDEMQQNSKVPLFIGTDEEGGSVARIAKTPGFDVQKFDSMQAIGKSKDPKNAKKVGMVIGSYLKKYGVNLDFAPVADVNTNPDNIVIGNRSFGNEPKLVAKMVAAEIENLHKKGVMSCIKHFPGHGDTKDDTHNGFVAIDKSWEELKKCELIPFEAGINAQTDMIMISHITAENITDDELPSSLSHEMIEGKLRKELNYDGVVITDSMYMGAIINQYSSGDAAIMAISAGADIVLMPENYIETFDDIYKAVENKTLSEERIDQSVLRILSLKEKYGLLQ